MTTKTVGPLQVTADLIRSQWWVCGIFWVGLYALFGGISLIVEASVGIGESVWIGACWWSQYLLMALGIMVTGQHLRVYIGHGVTRRSFSRGAAVFGLLTSVAFGVLMELGFIVEQLLAARTWGEFDASRLFVATPAHILQSTLEFSLLHLAYFFGGLFIATAFYRFGVVYGLLSIVPALLPGLLMDVFKLGAQPLDNILTGLRLDHTPRLTVLLVNAVLILAVAAASFPLLRTVSISNR